MEKLDDKLNLARNGKGLLFCGAGFSADSLSFSNSEAIGTAGQLKQLLSDILQEKGEQLPKKLPNIAQKVKTSLGEYGLMTLLQDKYDIKNVTSDICNILNFPWETIYTTNYDNAIELCFSKNNKKYRTLNNLDKEQDTKYNETPIIHLHGFIKSWDIKNFEKSCILDADSYTKIDNNSAIAPCLRKFRERLDHAEIIVFIGYNVEDIHLKKIINNTTLLKEKIFFINQETSEADQDTEMEQKEFGHPLYHGREGFSKIITKILAEDKPKELNLSSFIRYNQISPLKEDVTTKDIEKLFISGEVNYALLARDIDEEMHNYHIPFILGKEIEKELQGNVKIALLSGGICDGKTFLAIILKHRLSKNRPIFELGKIYPNVLDEVASIYDIHDNAILVIENCFTLGKGELIAIAKQIASSKGKLLLTARDVSSDASSESVAALKSIPSFKEFSFTSLKDQEITILSNLADSIAGWSEFPRTDERSRRNFIIRQCESSLPNFLMRLLESAYVQGKYKTEWNKINFEEDEKKIIIAILYISSLGDGINIDFLSEIFRTDIVEKVNNINKDSGDLRLCRVENNMGRYSIETIPSIGMRNILKNLVNDKDIIDTVAFIATKTAENYYRDAPHYHISRFIRYSLISPLIENQNLITTFFDQISQHPKIREHILFWLQWSIALRELGQFTDSHKKLEQAYQHARQKIDFNHKHLDDVKARLYIAEHKASVLEFSKFNEEMTFIMGTIEKYLTRGEVTHHTYRTLREATELFIDRKGHYKSQKEREVINKINHKLEKLILSSETYLRSLSEGSRAKQRAEEDLKKAKKLLQ